MASVKELVFSLKTSFFEEDFCAAVEKLEAREFEVRKSNGTLTCDSEESVKSSVAQLEAEKLNAGLEISGLKEDLKEKETEVRELKRALECKHGTKYVELLMKLRELEKEKEKMEEEREVLKADKLKEQLQISRLKEALKQKEEDEEAHYSELFALSDGLASEKKSFDAQIEELMASHSAEIAGLLEKCKRSDEMKEDYLRKINDLEKERRESQLLVMELNVKVKTAFEKDADFRRMASMQVRTAASTLAKYKKCKESFILVEGERMRIKAELEEMKKKYFELEEKYRKLATTHNLVQMNEKIREDFERLKNRFIDEIHGDNCRTVNSNTNIGCLQVSSSFTGVGIGAGGPTRASPLEIPSSSSMGVKIRDGETMSVHASRIDNADYISRRQNNIEPSVRNSVNNTTAPSIANAAPPLTALVNTNKEPFLRNLGNKEGPLPIVTPAPPVSSLKLHRDNALVHELSSRRQSVRPVDASHLDSVIELSDSDEERPKNHFENSRHSIEGHGNTMVLNSVNASKDVRPNSHHVPPIDVQKDKINAVRPEKEATNHENETVPSPKRMRLSRLDEKDGLEDFGQGESQNQLPGKVPVSGDATSNAKEYMFSLPSLRACDPWTSSEPDPQSYVKDYDRVHDHSHNIVDTFGSMDTNTGEVERPIEENVGFQSANMETQVCHGIGRPLLEAVNEEADFGYEDRILGDRDVELDSLCGDFLAAPLDWRFEADMLTSLDEDDELCLKGFCALYRRRLIPQAPRYSALGLFLTDRDPSRILKKSVEEVMKHDPCGIEDCRRVCIDYSMPLFDIFLKEIDPHFP